MVQPRAVLQAVHPGLDRPAACDLMHRVDRHPPSGLMRPPHRRGQHADRQPRLGDGLLVHNPVAAQLHPAVPGRGLPGGGIRQFRLGDMTAPAREIQARRAQLRPGGDDPRQLRVLAGPAIVAGLFRHVLKALPVIY